MAKAQSAARPTEIGKKSGEMNLGGLTELLGFHLRLAQVAMWRDFSEALKELDLTQKQQAVLSLLSANPGCSQIELGIALDTDRATMMAVVDRLQDRHFLFRTRSRSDRRRQELYLTDEGRSVLAEAVNRIRVHEQRFTSRFSPAELAQFMTFLHRLYDEPIGG